MGTFTNEYHHDRVKMDESSLSIGRVKDINGLIVIVDLFKDKQLAKI